MNRVGNELAVSDWITIPLITMAQGGLTCQYSRNYSHPGPTPQADKIDANFAIKLELISNAHSLGAQMIENIKVEE